MLRSRYSDARLVRRTLSGQLDAFSTLVERYERLIFASAYGIVANAADAEDVTQDSFLTAYCKLPSLREPSKFRSWILTIVRNRSADLLTRRKRETLLDEANLPPVDDSDAIADAELRALLRDRIERLPMEHREVLLLHYYAGLKVRDIALQLDISLEAAKKRLQRARDLLSQRMLVQLRETIDGQSPSPARTKTIITLIAGTTVTWKTSAAAVGRFTLKSVLASSRTVVPFAAVAGLGAVGLITFMVFTNERDETTMQENLQTEGVAVADAEVDEASLQTNSQPNRELPAPYQVRDQAAPTEFSRQDASSGIQARKALAAPFEQTEEAPGWIDVPSARVQLVGVVVNEDGVPISDARITVVATGFTGLEIEPEAFRAFRDPNHHYVARSDAKGEYSIPSIGYSGNARINVWAKGYANVNSQFMVEPGGAPITLDITLPKKGLLLKARILDGLGNPVPDAFVVAPSWNSNSGMSRSVTRFFGQTDETGHVQLGFAMLGGSSGTSGIAHLLVSSPFAGVASFNGVPIGKESVVDLRMEPPATMRGRIEPSEDLGLFPRKVVLSEVIELDGSRDFGYTSTYIAPVSIDGEFVLDTIPPNRAFTLWVQDNYNGDIIAREKLKPFSPGEVRSLNRSAGTGVVVQGTVYGAETGQPIPNVRVGHGYDAWQIVDGERAWTDENGKYTLVVSSEIESVNMFSAHAFIRETELQRLASEFGERFEIRRSLYEGVDLRIPDPIELTIQVLDISKHPIRHAAVIVNGTQLDYTNSSGICTLALNSAYVDSIRVRKHGYIHSRIEDSLYELQAPTTMNLHVLLRTAAGGLEGWFRRSDGTPIVNATVHAEGLHDSGTAYSVDSETNAEGKFILLDWCPEGSYERIELSLEHQDAHGRKILENVELESGEVLVLDPIDGE